MAAAAVLEKEGCDRPERMEVGAVDDRAASPLRSDQPSARENRQMSGERVVRNRELPCDVSRRRALRLAGDKDAKHVEARRLRQRCQSENRTFIVHKSRTIDISFASQRRAGGDAWSRFEARSIRAYGRFSAPSAAITETTISPLASATLVIAAAPTI